MTVPNRIYRLAASEEQVDRAGTPPRPESSRIAHEVHWNVPDAELPELPALRRWLRDHGVTDVCGRATRRVGDGEEFARPRYSYRFTFQARLADWSWSTAYGQQVPLVSHAVAELLLDLLPTTVFLPHGGPQEPDAFLPERYRQPAFDN